MSNSHSNSPTRRAVMAGTASSALLMADGTLNALLGQTAGSTPRRGGTMTMFYLIELALVPLTTSGTFGSAKITEGLFWYDHDMKPQPQLATGYSVSDDTLTYTFQIRKGVRWHDGRDFTAADVVYSIETLKRVHPRGRSTFAQVKSIEAPDPFTVVLKLSAPTPYLMKALMATETPMVPKHIYEGTDLATNPANGAPIGTGPFRFKERVPGNYTVFERNDDYWDAPRPYLDRIVVKYITDPGARSAALESGGADLTGRSSVAASDIARLRTVPTLAFESKGYESNQNVSIIYFNLDNKYFSDLRVRQAVAHAINRKTISDVIFYGEMEPCASPIGPALRDFHDPSPTPYPYDVAKAERLLDEAGYKRGPDNIRFRIIYDQSPIVEERARFADYFRAALTRIGIGVEVRSEDTAGFLKRVYTDRDFAITSGNASNLFDPTVGVQRLYWSKNFVKGVPFSNCSHYNNPRVDELLEAAAVEPSLRKRQELFKEFQQIVMRELPAITIGAPKWYTIYNKRVQGHSTTAEGVESNLAEAYIVS